MAVFKVGATFAHSRSKTTTRWRFNGTKRSFCINVTMDETWIHHFIPESNWQSAEWTAAGESYQKWPKMQTSAGKLLASVFWDGQGILFIDYLEKGKTINNKYYIALVVCLKDEIAKNSHKWRKKCFHQDNTLWHKSIEMMVKLHELHFKLFLHPPYSLDLSPSNYWLFADLKRMLQGKRFCFNEEVILETEEYFEAKDKLFNKKGIKLLEKRLNKCIILERDYVDE